MKTLQILALIVVISISGTTLGQSKEKSDLKKEEIKELRENLKKQFRGMPFDEIMCESKECYVSVSFKINDEGIVEYNHILSKNSKLRDYSTNLLANNEIRADQEVLNQEVYFIKLIFQYNEF